MSSDDLHQRRSTGDDVPVVAIIGAGCAGTLLAANLLRSSGMPLEIALIERTGAFGPGVAYGTHDPQHLLNVVAERMSAFCEQPLHLCEWAQRELGDIGPAAFIPRRDFGRYLESVLAHAEREANPGRRLRRVTADAVDARDARDGIELILEGSDRIVCDRVALALGNPPAARIEEIPEDHRILPNPWVIDAVRAKPGSLTLIVGMGLTAVDTILSLTTSRDDTAVLAVSPGGRFPHAHLPGVHTPAPAPELPDGPLDLAGTEKLIRAHIARMQSKGYDWRDAIDGLRPVTTALWSRLSPEDRRLFLHSRARDWERARHRMAPAAAERLEQLTARERLSTLAARLTRVDRSGRRLRVELAIGEQRELQVLECDQIVVCAGPSADIRRSPNRLLQSLLRSGRVSADELALGLRATSDGALIDARCGSDQRMFALGSMRRGELWETTAVREIRQQARDLALVIDRSIDEERPTFVQAA